MLKAIVYTQAIDFLFFQEVTIPVFPPFASYRTYVNLSATHCGTPFIIRDRMWLDNVDMMPSGPVITVFFPLYLVNIHAKSRKSRSEKEEIFNGDLSYLCLNFAQFHVCWGIQLCF
jgi:hypothetical protein